MTPRVSVLIVSFNTCQLTLEAIGSVASEPEVEVIVVDNASRDDSPSAIARAFPSVRLICSEVNLGFAGGVNRAASVATGSALLVLNSDARLEPGALSRMLALLEAIPRAALVAPALYYPDGRPQAAAFKFPGLLQIALDLHPVDRLMDTRVNGRIHTARPTPIDHPLGACMLIRRTAWDLVGPLDEGYFMYLEEVDWCRRAWAHGWQVWQHPGARAIHHGGASTSQQREAMFAQLWRARLRYYRRFHGPLYNRVVHALVRVGLRSRRSPPLVRLSL
ncbi:MAG: glycosyltransferase family 2 protein [Chloroflexi bacterium]|nr:glycosyltransferase family 2 protein [Chloroflexota bacterium]